MNKFRAALIRAARTAAQTALTALGAGKVDIIHASILGDLSLAAGAAVVSLLTSVVTDLPEAKA